MRLAFMLFTFFFLTLSCRDVALDFEETESTPTLNAILISNQTPQVSLTYTISKSSGSNEAPPTISDAEVELYENGNFVEDLLWDETSKTYIGSLLINPNSVYKVIAKIPNENWLEGEALIPNPPQISLRSYTDTVTSTGSNTVKAWHLFLTATFASNNQGMFATVSIKPYRVYTFNATEQQLSSHHEIQGTRVEYYFMKQYYLLGEHVIQPNFQADFSYIVRSFATQQPSPSYDSIYTYIDVMSNDLYEYMMLLDKINARNLYDPYVEPPTSYSNVKNGMGIVGGIGRGGHSLKPE